MEWVQARSFVLLGDYLKEFWVCLTCFDSPVVAIVGICGDSVANGHLAAVAATVITGVEPLLCVLASIVLAYASEWASLCLFAANKLYDKLWQKIKNQHRRNLR